VERADRESVLPIRELQPFKIIELGVSLMQLLNFDASDTVTISLTDPADAAQSIGENMAGNTKEKSDVKWWITTGLIVVGMVGGTAWRLEYELSKIDKHISRVETAVRIVGAKQGGDTKTVIDEVLTAAQNAINSGRIDSAIATLNAMGNLLKEQPLQVDKETSKEIGVRALKLTTTQRPPWKVTNAVLTSYSFALPPPPLDETKLIVQRYTNSAVECITIGRADNWIFRDFLFENCTAHIDALFGSKAIAQRVYISNSVFKNVRIVYSGGPLLMKGIYFESCTFDLEPSTGSESIATQLLAQNQPFNLYLPETRY
jgi:hypothetical protein